MPPNLIKSTNCTCKNCGKRFRYDADGGYSRDLCGPHCDGAYGAKQVSAKRISELVKACEAALAWRVADFDTIAEMFYRETGYLRPGKDYPAGMGGETVRKEAADAWNIWVDRKNAELTDQLTTALTQAKEGR